MQLREAAASLQERKRDAREKIQLGGLIAKAGLKECDKAVLLGCLIELAKLDPQSSEWQRLKALGSDAFRQTPS
jgi:hypothetical protein